MSQLDKHQAYQAAIACGNWKESLEALADSSTYNYRLNKWLENERELGIFYDDKHKVICPCCGEENKHHWNCTLNKRA